MSAIELPSADDVSLLLQRWCAASPDFAALVDRYGHAAAALRHIGLAQWQATKLDIAAEAFLAALTLKPEDVNLWRDLAGVYDGAAEAERAETCVKTALAVDPDQAVSWLMLAGLVDRRGDHEQAEQAYGRSIALDPTLSAAHLGLGLVLFRQRRFDAALGSLRAAVSHDPASALALSCLGHVLYLKADFAPSAAAFAAAANLAPLDSNSRRKHARALTFQRMIEGQSAEALDAYADLAGSDREDLDTISSDAFSLLSAYGHLAAAVDIGRLRLAQEPEDPIRRYLLDAVTGQPLRSAPIDYVERYFDRFAPTFEHKLVETLGYRAPGLLCGLIAERRTAFSRILDLGCGTGLAAERLATLGGELIGVDLSAGMLEEARKPGRYNDLLKAEALAYLDQNARRFDLVFAADLLIYFGDLEPLIHAASRALVAGGLLAISLETTSAADFALLPSGRFAHARGYVERVIERDFRTLRTVEDAIRLEAGRPVEGLYLVLERRS